MLNDNTEPASVTTRPSERILNLAEIYKLPTGYQAAEGVARIKVHGTISKLAFIYEKIRNTLDYRDEHLFRIYAILRILKRRLFFEEKRDHHAETLIKELIRGGYLDNDVIPETKIGEVDVLIEKYTKLIDLLPPFRSEREKDQSIGWIMSLAAGEIEDSLAPNARMQGLINLMYEGMKDKIVFLDEGVSENERDLQIFIAIHRALTRDDATVLTYEVFKCYYPDWTGLADSSLIGDVAANLKAVRAAIDRQINHPAGERLYQVCQKKAAPFLILGDIFGQHSGQIESLLESPELLEEHVRSAAGDRYRKIRLLLKRSAWRSVIYVFITKVLLALILEIPYDLWIAHHFYLPAIFISIALPPLMMFALVSSVKIPQEKNTIEITREIMQLVYLSPGSKAQYNQIRIFSRRPAFLQTIFTFVNVVFFIVSFGAIIWALNKLNFSIFSQIIFLIFLTAISYFAVQIRRSVNQVLTVEKKENVLGLLADLFGFPLVQVGRWLSFQFRSINIAATFFDVFIEVPVKNFISFSEEWTAYLKEKKEEIGNP